MTPRSALAALAALIAVAVAGGSRGAPPARKAPTGFDHAGHAAALVDAETAAPPCRSCHEVARAGRLAGAPDHGACFGACHGEPPPAPRRNAPYPLDLDAPERRALCRACHAPAVLDALATGQRPRQRGKRAALPAARRPSDFALRLSHRTHNPPGSDRCRSCHGVPTADSKPARAAAHARCIRCHGKRARPEPAPPVMTDCEGCHAPRTGPTPGAAGGPLASSIRFSHASHLARGQTCLPCHDTAAAAEVAQVPPPDKSRCTACHDGRAAFSTVAPRCRTCHDPPRDPPDRPALARTAFSHGSHALLGVGEPCAQCHELDEQGAPRAAARDHRACAQPACHAPEFAAMRPSVCGACHVGTAPWRPLHAEPPPRPTRDFAVAFSHADHLGTGRPAADRACDDCHGAEATAHAGCSDDDCHGDGGATGLANCGACHRDAALEPPAGSWSVAARFGHEAHRVDASGARLPCASCHGDVAASGPDRPAKATCAPCHDGGIAFKMTGHGCARCHGPVAASP